MFHHRGVNLFGYTVHEEGDVITMSMQPANAHGLLRDGPNLSRAEREMSYLSTCLTRGRLCHHQDVPISRA